MIRKFLRKHFSDSLPKAKEELYLNPWNDEKPMSYTGMWLGCRLVQRHINQKMTNNPDVSWLEYAIDRYAGDLLADKSRRCLILGANEGWIERYIRQRGLNCTILATDIADKALSRAKAASEALGYSDIEYRVADLNNDSFTGPFDCIIAEGVLHHIEKTERLLRHLNDLLTPNGVLVGVEFEGPFRFQLPEIQVRWINAALASVPGDLRPDWRGPKGVPPDLSYLGRIQYVCPSAESVKAADPSEAVAGPALKELCGKVFRVIEKKGFGGTLLSYMGGHFPFERADEDPYVGSFLQVLLSIEDHVIRSGILEDEFFFYVFEKGSSTATI